MTQMKIGKIYHDKDLGYIKYIGKRNVGKLIKDTFQTLGTYKSNFYLHKKELASLTEYTGNSIYTINFCKNITITKTENK